MGLWLCGRVGGGGRWRGCVCVGCGCVGVWVRERAWAYACVFVCGCRARDTGEAQLSGRDWWAALDGQARDQSRLARATDPRATETVLELRIGARFGSGTGERDRERALEEAAVVAAARRRAVAASWLDSSRKDVEDAAGGAVGGCVRASGGASDAQDPGDADRNGALELGKHGNEFAARQTSQKTKSD